MATYRGVRSAQVFDSLATAKTAIPASGAVSIEVWEGDETVEFVRDPAGPDLTMYDGSRWRREISGSAAAAIAQAADAKADDALLAKQPPFTTFDSYAEFIAANIPAPLNTVSILTNGAVIHLTRNASGNIVQGDLSTWVPADDFVSLNHWGSIDDVSRFGANGSITSASTTFTTVASPFVSSDVGKLIRVTGAGTGGAKLIATIVSVTDASTVELSVAAGTTVGAAEWAFGSDSTVAFDKMFEWIENAGAGGEGYLSTPQRSITGPINDRPVYIPAGHYFYNGEGYHPDSPRSRNIRIEGAGKTATLVEITSDAWLIEKQETSTNALNYIDVSHMMVAGGRGLFINFYNTGIPQHGKRFDNLTLIDFTTVALASYDMGVPRWQITDCVIESEQPEARGIVLNGQFANINLTGTRIHACKYKIVCPPGTAATQGTAATFFTGLSMFNLASGNEVADFWFTTGENDGQGGYVRIINNRFSNEHRNGKPWVLIADVDAGSGAWLHEQDHSTVKPTVAKYFRGLRIEGNAISGQGSADIAPAGYVLQSYTDELGDLTIQNNDVSGFREIVHLEFPPTEGYISEMQIGPNWTGGRAEPPKPCNLQIGRWLTQTGAEIPSAQTNLGSNGGWDHNYKLLSLDGSGNAANAGDWTVGGLTSSTSSNGPFGQSGARNILFTTGDGTDYIQIPTADLNTIAAGQNCFLTFDYRNSANPLDEVDVEIQMTTASGNSTIRQSVFPTSRWMSVIIPFRALETMTGLRVRYYPSPDNFSAGVSEAFRLDNVAVYAANRPVNTGHMFMQNAGWTKAKIVMGETGGQKRMEVWPDWTANLMRFKNGSPTSETDGLALLGAMVAPNGTFAPFTPTIEGSTTAGTGTYSAQEGQWMQIGKLVVGFVRIVWTAHNGAGNTRIRLAGLPLVRNNATSRGPFMPMTPSGFTLTAGTVMTGYVGHNDNFVSIQERGNTGDASVPLVTSGTIYGLFAYEAG